MFRLFLPHCRAKEAYHPRGQLARNSSGCAVYKVSFYTTTLDLFLWLTVCTSVLQENRRSDCRKCPASPAHHIVLWRRASSLSTTSTARQCRLDATALAPSRQCRCVVPRSSLTIARLVCVRGSVRASDTCDAVWIKDPRRVGSFTRCLSAL